MRNNTHMRLCSRLPFLVAAALSLATAAFAELNQPPAELAFLPSVLKVRDDWVAEHFDARPNPWGCVTSSWLSFRKLALLASATQKLLWAGFAMC
jgi:hypothetical protein